MKIIPFLIFPLLIAVSSCQQSALKLSNDQTVLSWKKEEKGWGIHEVKIKVGETWKNVGVPSGEYTLLYSEGKPDSTQAFFKTTTGVVFPEPVYRYQKKGWAESTQPVALNTAGTAYHFYPAEVESSGNSFSFRYENEVASVISSWRLDPETSAVVMVDQVLVAKRDGYFSLASPTLASIPTNDMAWATVPGYFQSNEMQSNFVAAYAYGHGVPELPVLYRERAASTLSPTIDTKEGVSLSVIPAPGSGRDPWTRDRSTQEDWFIGLSHKNRKSELTPTLYYPVLGEPHSKLKVNDTLRFSFQYSIISGNWFDNLNYAVNKVYRFKEGLALRTNKQSLTKRVERMHHYLTDTRTSLWNIEQFEGVKIGAQSYLGGVVGSDRDAMKNADYGAMWMLARTTGDPFLKSQVLPYALNFKLKQQEIKSGFFQGAAIGQYYLAKRKMFVEEWGEFIEPISLTYYTMLDIGNMLLFEPNNTVLQERLRLGADLLLKWQKEDGSWEVAYDRNTHEPLFTDIKDLRPTFYGLVVAYRILKDEKYLTAARKGADWLVINSVDKGQFLGVCGDARYAPDFATGQTAQILLDLYDLTKNEKYKEAAIQAAKIYTTSVYTHPVSSRESKLVKGKQREDWEIAQAGLSFEHGGILGSAQRHGPIQLASHAGMFIRIFQLTHDSIFADMARASAIGRDAFVDSATSVASYYWNAMSNGAGPYPHHAWWQIGWITDYLMAEAELRSEGEVLFPRGFVTPKVGPHQTYGFMPGKIYGEEASLVMRDGLLKTDEPNIECITALSSDHKRLFIVLLNDVNQPLKSTFFLDVVKSGIGKEIKSITDLKTKKIMTTTNNLSVAISPYGIEVYAIGIDPLPEN